MSVELCSSSVTTRPFERGSMALAVPSVELCSSSVTTRPFERGSMALAVPSVGTGLADVGLLLCRTAAVSSRNVLLLLGFGAYFPIGRCAFLFRSSAEGYSVEDDIIYVVACKLVHSF